jgi:hypothetical protein
MATAKKNPTVGPTTTGLSQGYGEAAASGGGIQPGAHPEMDADTPMDKLSRFGNRVGTFVLGGLNRLNSTGNTRSPSTKKDRGRP